MVTSNKCFSEPEIAKQFMIKTKVTKLSFMTFLMLATSFCGDSVKKMSVACSLKKNWVKARFAYFFFLALNFNGSSRCPHQPEFNFARNWIFFDLIVG